MESSAMAQPAERECAEQQAEIAQRDIVVTRNAEEIDYD